jgi:hypothetical protein
VKVRKKHRANREANGSVLALTLAVLAGFIVLFLLFALAYVRFIGTNQEQRSAIESAALAAASDLSRIVVDDPALGLISLSDYAPTGSGTIAADNYAMPVRSINTVWGSVMQSMDIAFQCGDSTLEGAAIKDYDAAVTASQRLRGALALAVLPGGSGLDCEGKEVRPYDDALKAYKNSVIRLTGHDSAYVNGSLTLSLGCIPGLSSCIPKVVAGLRPAHCYNNEFGDCFLAYTNYRFKGRDFVFAGVDSKTQLVNLRQFKPTLTAVDDKIVPCVVKAEANQRYSDIGGSSRQVHATACAQPGGVSDPLPAPGALIISFPDGVPAGIQSVQDLQKSPLLVNLKVSYHTARGGDYPAPGTSLAEVSDPSEFAMQANAASAISRAMYDWLRRQSLIRSTVSSPIVEDNTSEQGGLLVSQPFDKTSDSVSYVYTFGQYRKRLGNDDVVSMSDSASGSTGGSSNSSAPLPAPLNMLSENQVLAVSTDPFVASDGKKYDVLVQDLVIKPGRIRGGAHGGEPRPDPRVAKSESVETYKYTGTPPNIASSPAIGWRGDGNGTSYAVWKRLGQGAGSTGGGGSMTKPSYYGYKSGSNGQIVRPTYQRTGLAVEIIIRESAEL